MPESNRSSQGKTPDHNRQEDIRRVAKILRDGNYSYDQSAHLIKKARRRVGLSPPDRSGSGSPERLSSEEQESFLEAAYDRDGRTGLQMRVLLETGARVSAFVQVRVEDISFRDLEIRLRHTKGDRPRDGDAGGASPAVSRARGAGDDPALLRAEANRRQRGLRGGDERVGNKRVGNKMGGDEPVKPSGRRVPPGAKAPAA